uniref:Uncharacterized protein n=1 Tax=Glossina brevipalpis TaxID=37001 RepID=A0A1A9W4X0_9MUSC
MNNNFIFSDPISVPNLPELLATPENRPEMNMPNEAASSPRISSPPWDPNAITLGIGPSIRTFNAGMLGYDRSFYNPFAPSPTDANQGNIRSIPRAARNGRANRSRNMPNEAASSPRTSSPPWDPNAITFGIGPSIRTFNAGMLGNDRQFYNPFAPSPTDANQGNTRSIPRAAGNGRANRSRNMPNEAASSPRPSDPPSDPTAITLDIGLGIRTQNADMVEYDHQFYNPSAPSPTDANQGNIRSIRRAARNRRADRFRYAPN